MVTRRRYQRITVAAATAADHGVIIMDPLAAHWTFQRAHGNVLHPTAAGDTWIARTVEGILVAHGVHPATSTTTTTLICDNSAGARKSVGARKPVRATA